MTVEEIEWKLKEIECPIANGGESDWVGLVLSPGQARLTTLKWLLAK
jgi:hypothetical protein